MVQETSPWSVYVFGPCQRYILTMLIPYLAKYHFWMGWSSEIIKTESIWLKAYVYSLFNLWAMTGSCLDPFGIIFCLTLHPDLLELYNFQD